MSFQKCVFYQLRNLAMRRLACLLVRFSCLIFTFWCRFYWLASNWEFIFMKVANRRHVKLFKADTNKVDFLLFNYRFNKEIDCSKNNNWMQREIAICTSKGHCCYLFSSFISVHTFKRPGVVLLKHPKREKYEWEKIDTFRPLICKEQHLLLHLFLPF